MRSFLRLAVLPAVSAHLRSSAGIRPFSACLPRVARLFGPTTRTALQQRSASTTPVNLQIPITELHRHPGLAGTALGSREDAEIEALLEDDIVTEEKYTFEWESAIKSHGIKDVDIAVSEDHHEILRVYEMFVITRDPKDRQYLLDNLIRRIAIHSAAEEAIVYPELLNIFDRNAILRDLHDIKQMLMRLERGGMTKKAFTAELEGVMAEFRDHVSHEETSILPALRVYLGASGMDLIRTMGKKFGLATAITPSHPHLAIHDLGDGALQLPIGSVKAIYDAVKVAVAEAVQAADTV